MDSLTIASKKQGILDKNERQVQARVRIHTGRKEYNLRLKKSDMELKFNHLKTNNLSSVF